MKRLLLLLLLPLFAFSCSKDEDSESDQLKDRNQVKIILVNSTDKEISVYGSSGEYDIKAGATKTVLKTLSSYPQRIAYYCNNPSQSYAAEFSPGDIKTFTFVKKE